MKKRNPVLTLSRETIASMEVRGGVPSSQCADTAVCPTLSCWTCDGGWICEPSWLSCNRCAYGAEGGKR